MNLIRLILRIDCILALCTMMVVAAHAHAQTYALSSWKDRPAKQAIVEFVQATTTQDGPKFVPPEERIATFDHDGTLWVEHPMYSQVIYCLGRVPAVVKAKPELKNVEPFKEVLSGNREAMAKFSIRDLEKILAANETATLPKWLRRAHGELPKAEEMSLP